LRSRLTALVLLLAAIALISIYYHYPSMLSLLPQGSHIWRQADCMAMAQNYRQFRLPFFQPEIYNLQSVHGKVAGEFPVLYFFSANFSNPAFALRLTDTLIFIAGIIAAYFVAFYFLQRRLLSIFCSLLLFTSPLLVFYGNNFLSDVPALSFAFIGWAIFLHSFNKNSAFLLVAFIFFTFSVLLKASHVCSLGMCVIFSLMHENKKGNKVAVFVFIFFSLLISILWYQYAISYNTKYHDTYYFLRVSPVWNLSLYDIGLGIWRMTVSWSKSYFWRPTSVLLILSAYFLWKYRRKLDGELRLLIAVSFMLTLLYVIFFYQKMIGHEYYYTAFYVFVLFGLVGIIKIYNYFYAENVFSHTALFIFLLFNIIYCKNFVSEKLTDNLYNGYLSSTEMQDFLTKNRVTEDKIILSIPDESTNKTLYLLKRKGYTNFNNMETILRERKADFLILSNAGMLNNPGLKPYLNDSLGNFHGIYLYRLK
jgi:hypothetical protein